MVALASAATLLSGCVRFDPTQDQPFTEVPKRGIAQTTTTPPAPLPGKPFPKQCPADGVMQGCLEATSGLIMGSDGKTALVAERATGAIKEIATSAEPKVKTVIPVDPSGDGGLSDIVLSPSYQQDRLMYAYISTPTDNRVIRVADGDVPKPILTGIPKGPNGNAGSLAFTSPTTLVVQTGTGGNPGAANDPNSLAGKVIRIEQPTTVDQAAPTTAMSGIGDGGAMCVDAANGALYVTDRSPGGDRLQKLTKDGKISTVWTWPDKPGVAGCAALDSSVMVNLVFNQTTVVVRQNPETGAVTGDPEVLRQKEQHGHVRALKLSADGNVWGGSINKDFGTATATEDVVFPLFPKGGGFPRANDDLD
ncbi:hypothetical protein BI330_23065 [Mycobacterium sp. CBMA 623]|nr:hypothetical protein [Mycobacteroides sp. CBMA 326]